MKIIVLGLFISLPSFAFDFKAAVEKAAKDKKTQEQIKDAAKKGYEYYQKKNQKKQDPETKKVE